MARLTAEFEMRDNISRRLRGLHTSLERIESTTQAMDAAMQRLGRARVAPRLQVIDSATGTIRTVQGQISSLNNATATPTISATDRLTDTLDRLDRRLNRINSTRSAAEIAAVDNLTNVLERIERHLDGIDSARATPTVTVDDQASSVIENIQGRLDQLQGAAITIGAAGGITGSGIIGNGSSAMEQDTRTAAVTGMSTSGVNSYVKDIFYDKKVGNSREEVAVSLQDFAQQTDLSGNQLKSAVETSNKIAMIHQKDIPEVDRAFSSMIKNFNIDSGRAGDNLAYIFKNAGDAHEDLLDTFNEYSPNFNEMKLTLEQTSAALVAGSEGGARNFDDMADSIREFNIIRKEMSDDQVAAFDKVLGADEAAKMFKGLKDGSYTGQEAMFRMAKGLSEIENRGERAALATTLIGTKFEDIGKPILDMAEAIDEPIKATDELNKQWSDFRSNDLTPIRDAGKEVQSIMEDIGSEIITNVAPSFEKLNKWMASKEGQDALKSMKETVTSIAGTVGAVLVPAIQYGIEHFNVVGPILGGITLGVLGIGVAFATLVPAVAVFKTMAQVGGSAFKTIKKIGSAIGSVFGRNQSNGVNNVTNSMSRMQQRAQSGSRGISGLITKLKTLFRINPPANHPVFGNGSSTGTRMGRRNTRAGGAGGGRGGLAGWGGKLGSLAKGVGRFALPVGIGLGAWDIFTSSPGQERNEAIGGAVGGIGGGLAGAAAGAAAGSVIPGIGTAIGGAVGGIGGYFGGDKIGSWIGGLFGGGDKKKEAAQPTGAGATAGIEKELQALAGKGGKYGKAFATNFSTSLNSVSSSITSWLSDKVYKPMGNAATSSNHFGYAFSYGFVSGLNTAPINVTTWLSEKVYGPMGNAAVSANHFGYAFSYGFITGLSSVPMNVTGWLSENVYEPFGNAAASAQHFGYAFSMGFMMGLNKSTLTMTTWISSNIYQPLGQAAVGSRAYGSALVYNFKEGIKAIPVVMSVWLKNHVETPTRAFVPKASAWGSGMIGYFVTGMNSQGSNVTDTAKNLAKRVEEAFRKELGIHSPSRVMANLGYWSAMGVVKGFSGVDVSNIAKSKADELMAAFGNNYSGGGAAMAQQAIMQALMMTGKPMSLLGPMMSIAKHESGFNPRAINDWDINAQRGDPSIGLFQIIGETFNRWKYPGANDRTNPLHSALAAIRYMDGRYGGIMNHPGIKSMSRGGGYKPYAKGGIITQDHIARVGEQGKKEVIIPLEQHRNRALGLLGYAQRMLGVSQQPILTGAGGSVVSSEPLTLPQEEVQTVQNVMSRTVQTVQKGIRDVIVQIMGESHYHNEMDAEKVGVIAVKAVEKKLEEESFAEGEMAIYE